MLARVRRGDRPTLLLDTGNLAMDECQADTIATAMRTLGYDAVGIGPMDLAEPARFAATLQAHELLALSVPAGVPPEAPPASKVFEPGGARIAVVTAGYPADPSADAYRAALRAVLQEARAGAQAVVLMSHLGRQDDEAILRSEGLAGLVDVLLGGQDAWWMQQPEQVGGAWAMPAVRKGRQLGLVRVTFGPEGPTFNVQMLELRMDLSEDPEMKALAEQYFAQRAKLLLQEAAGAPQWPDPGTPALPEVFSPEEASVMRARGYLTAPECGRCHPKQQEQWATTQHANALQTLLDRSRLAPECLQCHDEARRRGLLYEPEGADQYAVDCASCHGSGLLHAADPEANQPVRLPSEQLCTQCHQQEHSLAFEYGTYLPRVAH